MNLGKLRIVGGFLEKLKHRKIKTYLTKIRLRTSLENKANNVRI